jgi:hypothetical protein
MKIKRLKPNLTEVTASGGIVILFFGSMAVAARMKDGRYIAPDSSQKDDGYLNSTVKDDAVKWWVDRSSFSVVQTISTKVFKTLVEGI